MQTVITWTRYDGTPGTLPDEGAECLASCGGGGPKGPVVMARDDYGVLWWDFSAGNSARLFVGDLWAPWPDAPNGVE